MWPGLVPLESTTAKVVANAGISLSTARNVQLLCPLTVFCICGKATLKMFTASAILRGTVTTFTRERCEWHSGLETATLATRTLTLIQAGPKCPGSLLRRCQKRSNKHVTLNQLDFPENLKKTKL